MQTHVLQEGDYLGACKGFAELQDLQISTSGANQAQDGIGSALDESIHTGLPDNTRNQAIRGLSVTGPGVKGVGVKGEGGNVSLEKYIESRSHDPHCLRNRIYDTANINVLARNISKDDLWLSMDAGMLRDTSVNKNCYCCTENAMLSAVDNAVPIEQYTVAAGRASAPFRVPSLTSLGNTVLKGDNKDAGALSFLAHYIDMPVKDMRAMHRNGVTLGTLERLTTDDLLLLGMTIPRDAISLLKATTALATLRQLRAAAATERGRHQKLDRASSAKEPLPRSSAGRRQSQ